MDEEFKSERMRRRHLRSCAVSEAEEMDESVVGFKAGSSNGFESILRVRSEHMFSKLDSYGSNEESGMGGVRKRQKKMEEKSDDGKGQWDKY